MNRRYVGDITYLPVGEGKFRYLATVIDLASRRLTGWAIADHMRAELVIDALHTAERTRGNLAGAIMHTDHGTQYTSRAFADACRRAGVRQSMSAVGSSADNAAAESFNATCKREALQGRKSWSSKREARLETLPVAAPLQHRPPSLPPGTTQPDRLRAGAQHDINYAGASRITRIQLPG